MNAVITTILDDVKSKGTGGEARIGKPASRSRARILIVDPDQTFRERLEQELTVDGYEVLTAETGRRAFSLLRDWRNPIAWLYTRGVLDSLIDGRVLADEYHSSHPRRQVIIAASEEAGSSASDDVILMSPTPSEVADAIRFAIRAAQTSVVANSDGQSDAA